MCNFKLLTIFVLLQGILLLSHYPFESPPEWYDAALDQWQSCVCENCQCKNFQIVLAPPQNLCTCILLDDGRLFSAGGSQYGRALTFANVFDYKTNKWIRITDMHFERIKPYIVQLDLKVFVVNILFY